jgi:subtilisin family serine protease
VVIRRTCAFAVAAVLAAATVVVVAPAASADAVQRSEWYLSALGVKKAWTQTQGRGVLVGVVDTGVDGTTADLRGSVVGGADFSGVGASNGQKPLPPDPSHGTNVASLIAGHGHGPGGSAGILGTAPQAHLLTASFQFSPDNSPAAIKWLVDHGAKVINLSFGSSSSAEQSAIRYAESKDVVVVAASGDAFVTQRNGLQPPASFPGVVAVTGVDQNMNSDPAASIGPGTAIAAPFSTTPTNPNTSRAKVGLTVANPRNAGAGGYEQRSGTSFSAPIVAGIVALIRSKYPSLDAANVINRLIKTATPAGGSAPNNTYGYGIVNADRALTANVPQVTKNPLGSLAPSVPPSSSGSSAPSTPSSSSAGRPASSPAAPGSPTLSSPPVVSQPPSSSGPGAGVWVAIVVVVVIVAVLLGVLANRRRRPPRAMPPSALPPAPPPPPPGPPRSR